ncbi:MAG: flavodoxin family protein [Candidatus Methanoplasma sp.]|jgi:multimeric flavodoxin WrbA|nr:flavodoxin family protein [Candidatus Methanoplasma sp.]
MSIVAIIASPRKKGNTSTIVEAMVEGAKKNGKDVKTYYLNSLSNAKGCQACMGCKSSGACVLKDDHADILKAIRDAEGVILSTPIYFGDANGQFRLLQDRFYSFLNADFSSNIAPGKKLAVVVSCGGGADGAKATADKIEGAAAGMFKFIPIGKIVFTGANPPDTASKNSAILEEAKAIGKKF